MSRWWKDARRFQSQSYLSKSWGLGPQRADGVFLFGARSGISLPSDSSYGSGGVGGGGAAMNSEEILKFQAEQHQFAAQQIEPHSRYLKKDSRAGDSNMT